VQRELPEVSERRACRTLGQPRSTQRYQPKVKDDEAALLKRMESLVRRHPRFGYRRIHALLRREGWRVNRKRIHRLWRQEGYRVPQKRCKKRRLGVSEHGIMRQRAEGMNDVWAWDFIHDVDERGRPLKWLVIEDEFTREGLALEVARSIKAEDVLDELSQLMLIRGRPRHIRSDNGPEFIAQAVVLGQDQKFLAALIVPDFEALEGWAENEQITVASREALMEEPAVRTFYNQIISGLVNSSNGFKSFEQIYRFTLLPEDFTVGEELSAKQEIKRHIIQERYSRQIGGLFS